MELNSTDIFAERLRKLISDSGKTMRTISDEVNISVGALSKYQNGKATAGIDIASKLAQYFNVSTDYLIGFIDTPYAPHADIVKETGLTANAILKLAEMNKEPHKYKFEQSALNFLISNADKSKLLERIHLYLFERLYYTDPENLKAGGKLPDLTTVFDGLPLVFFDGDGTPEVFNLPLDSVNNIFLLEIQRILISLKKAIQTQCSGQAEVETDGEH